MLKEHHRFVLCSHFLRIYWKQPVCAWQVPLKWCSTKTDYAFLIFRDVFIFYLDNSFPIWMRMGSVISMRTYCSGRTPFGATRPLLQDNVDEDTRKNHWLKAALPVAHWAGKELSDHKEILGGLWSSFSFFLISLFVLELWRKKKKKKESKANWTCP